VQALLRSRNPKVTPARVAAELNKRAADAIRDQGPGSRRPRSGDGEERRAAGDHARHGLEVRQDRAGAHLSRGRQLPPRSPRALAQRAR